MSPEQIRKLYRAGKINETEALDLVGKAVESGKPISKYKKIMNEIMGMEELEPRNREAEEAWENSVKNG